MLCESWPIQKAKATNWTYVLIAKHNQQPTIAGINLLCPEGHTWLTNYMFTPGDCILIVCEGLYRRLFMNNYLLLWVILQEIVEWLFREYWIFVQYLLNGHSRDNEYRYLFRLYWICYVIEYVQVLVGDCMVDIAWVFRSDCCTELSVQVELDDCSGDAQVISQEILNVLSVVTLPYFHRCFRCWVLVTVSGRNQPDFQGSPCATSRSANCRTSRHGQCSVFFPSTSSMRKYSSLFGFGWYWLQHSPALTSSRKFLKFFQFKGLCSLLLALTVKS